jgi:hypothetical protein
MNVDSGGNALANTIRDVFAAVRKPDSDYDDYYLNLDEDEDVMDTRADHTYSYPDYEEPTFQTKKKKRKRKKEPMRREKKRLGSGKVARNNSRRKSPGDKNMYRYYKKK